MPKMREDAAATANGAFLGMNSAHDGRCESDNGGLQAFE
jgi:hypothetical protein